ncbi:Uncharacterized protein F383_06761 [Gossypium arboreum]|uniref:Uncharacterized protein n=1 Tax=Gossypium arboreum TaxID=29729 RepID=A0A0B0NJT2_GOSAR|nr:Uncharacterized protein F383_06761 [Gossypium arboreum]
MWLHVRPRLGHWHCTIYVIIRVSYPIPNGSSGKGKLCTSMKYELNGQVQISLLTINDKVSLYLILFLFMYNR